MTPDELFRYVEGINERIKNDSELITQFVYLNNVLARAKKLPKFEQIVKRKKRGNRADYERLKREFGLQKEGE